MARVIGADPGATGALVLVDTAPVLCVVDHVDLAEYTGSLGGLFSRISSWRTALGAVLEYPWARPGDGAHLASAWKLAVSTGQLDALLSCLGVPVQRVPPQVWKGALGLSADKQKSLEMARAKFAGSTSVFRLVKHHNRAEAALLAYWGARAKGLVR